MTPLPPRMVRAERQSYESLANRTNDPLLGLGGVATEMKPAMTVSGLPRLLEIERRTMKEA